MSNRINKLFLRYYDENGLGNKKNEEVRAARLAFAAGYSSALEEVFDDFYKFLNEITLIGLAEKYDIEIAEKLQKRLEADCDFTEK